MLSMIMLTQTCPYPLVDLDLAHIHQEMKALYIYLPSLDHALNSHAHPDMSLSPYPLVDLDLSYVH